MMLRRNTSIWFRNPWNYIRQISASASEFNITWNADLLRRKKMNQEAWLNMNLGRNSGWRSLVLYKNEGDAAVLYRGDRKGPQAAFPIWHAQRHSVERLMRYIEKPWGENPQRYTDFYKGDLRPRKNQPHIIVVCGFGNILFDYWRDYVDSISQIQAKHPEVTFLLHNQKHYPFLYGKNFQMADVDPAYEVIRDGAIRLPCGKITKPESKEMQLYPYWLEVLGYTSKDLENNTFDRVNYNIKSHEWASRYYKKITKFSSQKGRAIDFKNPNLEQMLKSNKFNLVGRQKALEGDKIACDHCSLWATCKQYREGAVCIMPESDMKKVAEMFGTRDASKIMDGMGKLLALNVNRIEKASLEEAKSEEGLDPELSKLVKATIDGAERLAKLRNPSLGAKGPQVLINNAGGQAQISAGDKSITPQVAAKIISELEAKGFTRDQITEEMIQTYLSNITQEQYAIEAEVQDG